MIVAGPGQALDHLFRARVFQSYPALEEALADAASQVGPPPPRFATAGRMNARGIAVFYGATAREVAISEIRPPVRAWNRWSAPQALRSRLTPTSGTTMAPYPSYRIIEITPPKPPAVAPSPLDPDDDIFALEEPGASPLADRRTPALRVDQGAIWVQEVQAVRYEASEFKVSYYQWERDLPTDV